MRSSDQTPTPDGIASLVERGLISPSAADQMRAGLALQAKLPAGYAVSGYSEPWFIVVKPWDGKPIGDNVSREITEKLPGLEVRGPRFEDWSLIWAVQGPEAEAEKPALPEAAVPARSSSEAAPRAETPTRETPRGGRSG